MAKKKQILYPVLFMLVLTIVYTFMLAFINESTAELISEQETLNIKRSVLYVLDVPSNDDVKETYASVIVESNFEDQIYYEYMKDGTLSGYVFPYTGTGLWGSISGYIAFSPDFSEL